MTLQSENLIAQINDQNKYFLKQISLDRITIGRGLDVVKEENEEFLWNKGLLDFSELKKQIQEIENHLNSAVKEKNLLNLINPMVVNSKKKRVEKEMSKELVVVASSQDSNEKRILDLIVKCKEIFPKLYNKLIDIYSIYVSKADFLANDQKIFNLNNLSSEGEKSCQVVIDEFFTKVNQYTISANSKLANEVILNMIKKLDEDYEMVGIGIEKYYNPLIRQFKKLKL